MSFAPRAAAGLASAVRAVLDDPEAAQRRAIAARERLTSDFDWHTVAGETAQVYLAAKRREREPPRRRVIVEHALPDRQIVRRASNHCAPSVRASSGSSPGRADLPAPSPLRTSRIV